MSDPGLDKALEERKKMDQMSAGELQAYLARQEQAQFDANYSEKLKEGEAERRSDRIVLSILMGLIAVAGLFALIKVIKFIWYV